VLAVVVFGSLGLSIWQTRESAPWAFFGAHTRAWELGLGALVALFAAECARLPKLTAVLGGWVGLAAVVASAFLYSTATPFPGYAALLPAVGAALILACGMLYWLPVLTVPPMPAIGAVSYSWYLWHWPLLLIGPHVLGVDSVVVRAGLALVALALAAVTYHLLENRVRRLPVFRTSPWKGVALGLALSAVIAAAACAAAVVPARPVDTGSAAPTLDGIGGAGLVAAVEAGALRGDLPSNLTPTLADAKARPPIYSNGCHRDIADTDVKRGCVFGDPAGRSAIVLFGDSHAAHWFDALDVIARQRGMRLVTVTKSACSAADALTVNSQLKRDYTECSTWRDRAWTYIRSLHPALVVMSSNGSGGAMTGVPAAGQDLAWGQAWATTVREVSGDGTKVAVILDTPWPARNVPDCVAGHPTSLGACARPPGRAVLQPLRRQVVAHVTAEAGATVIDPIPWFCAPQVCPVVVGNVLVYRDDSHMTTAYSAALAGILGSQLP
jgi:hypothetical protein